MVDTVAFVDVAEAMKLRLKIDNRIEKVLASAMELIMAIEVKESLGRSMRDENIWRLRDTIPMALNVLTPVAVKGPIEEPRRYWAAPEREVAYNAARILKIGHAWSYFLDHQARQIGPFLEGPIVITSNEDFVLSGLAFKPSKEVAKRLLPSIIRAITAMDQYVTRLNPNLIVHSMRITNNYKFQWGSFFQRTCVGTTKFVDAI